MRKAHKLVPYRRKRERKTNYKKRLRTLLSKKPRLVARMTNTRIIAQIISWDPKGDAVTIGLDSTCLKNHGLKHSMKSKSAAYLTGWLIAKRAVKNEINEAVFDTGFRRPRRGNRLSLFLQGALDGGLTIPHAEDIIPDEKALDDDLKAITHIKDNVKENVKDNVKEK